jgi:hypothetical protein
MGVPRRTGTLLAYAGSIGLATTFLLCVYLHEVLGSLRGWHCGYTTCNVPTVWSLAQTRDVLVLWFGGLRSILQIRAGLYLQEQSFDGRGPLVTYLVVAAIDCVMLASLGEIPVSALALAAGWPLFVFALTRTGSVRALVWERTTLPRARVL